MNECEDPNAYITVLIRTKEVQETPSAKQREPAGADAKSGERRGTVLMSSGVTDAVLEKQREEFKIKEEKYQKQITELRT